MNATIFFSIAIPLLLLFVLFAVRKIRESTKLSTKERENQQQARTISRRVKFNSGSTEL